MKKTVLFIALAAVALLASAKIKVYTIGDSTMADYDESTTDKRGWCTYLGNFLNPLYVEVKNHGKSGADTRSFYTGTAYWPTVKNLLQPGDYVLIQFAHNDEGTVTNGMDNLEYAAYCTANGLAAPTDQRGTNPQTTYRDFLRSFIDEAHAKGANPVLVGPICRKYFNGNDIKRNGRHDLGDKFSKIENGQLLTNQSMPASDHSMDYVEAMRIVAQEKGVPFLNLTEATRQLYLQYGEAQCTSLLFCSGDNTHTATLGANLIARLGAQLLKDSVSGLTSYVDIPTDITAAPAMLDMGETYSGIQLSKEVLLTGFGLTPAAGSVNITASGNLQISLDNQNFSQTAVAQYSGNTLFQRVYVHATYSTEGAQADSIVVQSGLRTFAVPVTAQVVSLAGGSDVKAFWSLKEKPNNEAVVSGPIAAQQSYSNMILWSTQQVGDSLMSRYIICDASGAKTGWPENEIDEVASRYVDFAVTAPTTMDIRVTGISMTMAANGGNGMNCHVNIGFGDGFTGVQTLDERKTISYQAPIDLNYTPTLTIPAGETLHVRVLPWYNQAATGKYICLSNMQLTGKAFPATSAIDEQQTAASVSKELRDGKLLIHRNGYTYNTQGQIIK